ncbi:MAG: efflux RND transporter permease subunit [Candidatus Paceibacterota bacterium]
MYSFWSFFTKHRNFSYLFIIALIGFGASSLISIPKESAPEVQVPVGVVTTVLTGASAFDIETLITNKLESALNNTLDEVKKITSSSQEGVSTVVVEFDASADIDDSIRDLKDAVDKIKPELPTDTNDPLVSDVNFVNQPVITFAIASDLPEQELVRLAQKVEEEIKRVPGVSDVNIGGFRERETQVIVNREALNTFNLRLLDVISAISRANNTFPIGNIVVNNIEYNVQFEGNIDDPREVADIAILESGGEPVYVRDVATVIDGLSVARTHSRFSLQGEPSQSALSFDVFKRSGGDVTKITKAVQERIEALKSGGGILEGVNTLIVYDTGEQLKKDLTSLTTSGLQTVLLVMIVLFIAIGWREALVAGSAIPLSFTIAFIALNQSGNTLNFVSLFALILAIGILVDSAIVIVEGINRNMKHHPDGDKKKAVLEAIRTFYMPLTSGTMTTVAVFAPLFFISGVTGQFIATIPFTIIFVLLASLLVALGFIPLISSLVLRRRDTNAVEKKQAYYTEKLQQWYRNKIDSILGNRKRERMWVWGAIVVFFITLSFPIIGLVKVEFFATSDQSFIIIETELPEGTVLAQSDLEIRKVEEILYSYSIIDSFLVTSGGSSAFTGNGGVNPKLANIFITLRDDRAITSTEMVEVLRADFKDIHSSIVRVSQASDGPPTGTPIVINFLGENLDAIEELSSKTAEILEGIPGTSDVTTSAKNDGIQFVVEVDTAKATVLGLDASIISQTLRAAVSGVEATSIKSSDEDIKVMVRLNLNTDYLDAHDTNRTTIDALNQLSIQTPNGPILLGSVLKTTLAKNNTTISHEDTKRVTTANAQLTADGNLREIIAEFKTRAETELVLPAGTSMHIGGENEENNQAFKEMFYALIVGLLLMLAILVLQFNSYRHALYVLSVTPLALIGIMIGLAVTGKALSFPSMMGFIALTGIVVNNSIILIDTINEIRKKSAPERDIKEIVLEGASLRLRPILLTTITTVVGIFPLTYASDLWEPLAWSIIFGLLFAVLLTLVIVPILYYRKPGVLK